jgi:uncharacterized LabA/DUF88 family protein
MCCAGLRAPLLLFPVIPRSLECGPRRSRLAGFFYLGGRVKRVVCLVDGFNLYHAIKRLKRPELKWLDLRALAERHTRPQSEQLTQVIYFSAYATWLPAQKKRHEVYVRALKERSVTVVLGHFKEKSRSCVKCGAKWKGHEEKETDVNIALALLRLAHRDDFDRCLLVTRDSDLAPAVRMVLADFPQKTVTVVCPPNFGHSSELIQATGGQKAKITVDQLEKCQLPELFLGPAGHIIAKRPLEFGGKG